MNEYTREELTGKNLKELKAICKNENIVGMSKKKKDVLVETIMQRSKPISGVKMSIKAQKNDNNQFESKVSVSSGASSGKFSLVNKSISDVASALRDILNIPDINQVLVNGKTVNSSYVVKSKDNIEFIKPDGEKG